MVFFYYFSGGFVENFSGLSEIQWLAISSIATTIGALATTVGVLIALFIPIRTRKKEKENLLYFISTEIEFIVTMVMNLKPDDLVDNKSEDATIFRAKQMLSFSFKTWDEKSGELAKYDRKLFELFEDIITSVRSAKNIAELWLNAESDTDKKMYKPLLDATLKYMDVEIEADIPLLKKYKLLQPRDPLVKLSKKLYYGASHPIEK
jgi:hypothetical protein